MLSNDNNTVGTTYIRMCIICNMYMQYIQQYGGCEGSKCISTRCTCVYYMCYMHVFPCTPNNVRTILPTVMTMHSVNPKIDFLYYVIIPLPDLNSQVSACIN